VTSKKQTDETLAFETADILPVIKEVLNSGKGFVLTVTGQSMRPTLRNLKDKVELSSVTSLLSKGDLLFFERENGAVVLHRVVKVCDNGYVVSGDSQSYTENVSKDRAIAVVTRVCRNGRWIDCSSLSYRITDYFIRITKPLRAFVRNVRRKVKSKN